MPRINTILLDLDGTLVDTAPDLAFALNTLLSSRNRSPLPFSAIRPLTGDAKGLIKLGFAIDENHSEFILLWKQLAQIYSQHIAQHTQLFPGMEQVIREIENKKLKWGIVTNKLTWLTESLLTKLNLRSRTNCVVSGDTLAKCKPDPEPLLHACELLKSTPAESIYIGDAKNDIIAGKAAGMSTMVALYGYIGAAENPLSWNADFSIQDPIEILNWLNAI